MKKAGMCCVAILLVAAAVPLFAQSAANDTLSTLLAEVRLLRMAMERSAKAPYLQLLGTRLAVQNQRLQEATREHAVVQNELRSAANFVAENAVALQRTEEQLGGNIHGREGEVLEQQAKQVKVELAVTMTREGQLRTRESSSP